MVPFGSLESYQINNTIFKHLRDESDRASLWMAQEWGEPKMLLGYEHRNTTRIAIAPTKSSSFIMGQWSPSIEPIKSNYHEKTLAKIQTTYKNPTLIPVLENYGKNTRETWQSILENNGSVQHLDFLSDLERDVFRTFSEISQVDIIKLAAQRQKYIDQGQSLNLMIHPKTSPKDVSNLVLMAHEEGLKTLYYQYSINAAQEFNENLMTCSSCEA
jgi:ribonucleoside-diphosphate reductase alpha chain